MSSSPVDTDDDALAALAAGLTADADAAAGARRCAKLLLERVVGATVVQSTLAAPMSPPLPRILTFPRPPAGAPAPPAERAGSSATAADTVAQGRPLTWSAGAAGESPPYADWQDLAASRAASAFATVAASLPGRPACAVTVGGTAGSMDVGAAAELAARVAALLAPYLALAVARAKLDVTQGMLTDAMPPKVVANMIERQALGMGAAVLGGEGGAAE